MGKFTLTHEIRADEEGFWKLFFDKEFNEQLFKRDLGFPEFKVLEQRDTDREIYRKVHGTPKLDVPGPVAKVIGANFSYTEEGTFDKASKTWRWKMTPSSMGDKLRNEGVVRVEPAGAGKVRRVAEITIEAKVFGIGGMIESSSEKQLRAGWDKSADVMNRWFAEHAAK
jgi:hypothetical protein